MEQCAIYAQLGEIFENVFDQEGLQLTPQTEAKDVDGWDSLTHVRLILSVERSFRTRFSTAEVGKLKNVGDLVALIAKHT